MPPSHVRLKVRMSETFRRLATAASYQVGNHWAFLAAFALTVLWILTGPLYRFSQGWQMVMNTVTSVLTFLMVFLLQATQNRDARAIHLKLDELIRASQARNAFLGIEVAPDDELLRLEQEFKAFRANGGEDPAPEPADPAAPTSAGDPGR